MRKFANCKFENLQMNGLQLLKHFAQNMKADAYIS